MTRLVRGLAASGLLAALCPSIAVAQNLNPPLQKIKSSGIITIENRNSSIPFADKIAQRVGRLVEMYLTVGVIHFVLCFAASQAVKRFQGRLSSAAT